MLTIAALSTLRMASGASFFAIPELTAKAFLVPYTGPVAIAARMAGARDFAVGALLYTCRPKNNRPGASTTASLPNDNGSGSTLLSRDDSIKLTDNKELRRALLTGILIDALDVLGCLWCYWEGTLPIEGLRALGGGAVIVLGVQIYTFYEVSPRWCSVFEEVNCGLRFSCVVSVGSRTREISCDWATYPPR